MKKNCTVHHFSYSGNVCPFCEKERFTRLANRFVKTTTVTEVINKHDKKEKESEITENDLQKLMNKFNNKSNL